jgi:phosphatidate cytidylyltransferase
MTNHCAHRQRWITGLAAVPFLIWLIATDHPLAFVGLIAAVTLAALWEFYRIVFYDQSSEAHRWLAAMGYAAALAMIWAARHMALDLAVIVLSLNLLGAGVIWVLRYREDQALIAPIALQVLGLIYIPLSLSFLILMHLTLSGVFWVFFLVIVIFCGDTGAYYVGRRWGRHKLCPAVSPGKTVEGALGGIAANLTAGLTLKVMFASQWSWSRTALMIICLGLAGQLGDLFESALKRRAGIKDSSALLPGHGGILDRIDALLFAIPVAYGFAVGIGL